MDSAGKLKDALAQRVRAQNLVFGTDAEPAATRADVDARNDPEAVRFFHLAAKPGPIAVEVKREEGRLFFPAIDEAERQIEHLYRTREALVAAAGDAEAAVGNVLQGEAGIIDSAHERVLAALADDLDTARAIEAVAELVKAAAEVVLEIPRLAGKKPAQDSARQLAARAVQAIDGSCAPLGLLHASADEFFARTKARRAKVRGLDVRAIDAKVRAREEARAAKNFARADALRKELDALGIDVLDAGDASTWRVRL
jgi:cysteinyl-tRNA synthetase